MTLLPPESLLTSVNVCLRDFLIKIGVHTFNILGWTFLQLIFVIALLIYINFKHQ